MDEDTYQAIIAILIVFLAVTVYMLVQVRVPEPDVTTVQYEQTPFQWYCPERPVNCSTVVVPANVTIEKEDIVYLPDGDTLPEPDPTQPPQPTPTTMPVSEFPFLHFRQSDS